MLGTGVFTQSGGSNTISGSLSLGSSFSGFYGSPANYSLSGGTLIANAVSGSGRSTFKFDGGLLQAGSGASGVFMSGLTWAYVASGGARIDTNGCDITIAQSLLDGGGCLTKLGSGSLVLSRSSSYTGVTLLAAGELSISSDSNVGGPASALTFAGGILGVTGTALTNLNSHNVNWSTFNGGFDVSTAANTFTVTQSLAGSGSLTKFGSGTLTLGGSNTCSGVTLVNSGTLALANPLALGQSTFEPRGTGKLSFGTLTAAIFGGLQGTGGSLSLLNSSGLAVTLAVGNNGFNTTFAGTLTGGGSLTKTGSVRADSLLAATPTPVRTTVSTGILQIVRRRSTGSLSPNGSVTDDASLVFNRSDTYTFSGAIGGTGIVTQLGSGTLVLTATNTFSDGAVLKGGELAVSSDANVGGPTSRHLQRRHPASDRHGPGEPQRPRRQLVHLQRRL